MFTDIHLGLKSNSKIHLQDCEEFVDWFIEKGKSNGCETGIFCGDWHHNRNTINVQTLDATTRCLEKLGKSFENFYFFAGNHDLYYKDKRDIYSLEFAKHIPGITYVDEILEKDDVALVPWLVGDEWKLMSKIKAKYMFGHFELPHFYMNAMVKMPEHGELRAEHFKNQEYVFSGHFHKRQVQGKIHYMGNAFPHNYADAWDDKRGMMILDKENNKEPVYIDWDNCPKYRTIKLSKLLDEKERLMMELGKDLEESFNLDDEDFFYDRVLFMKENYENDSETYKSNEPRDKRMIKNYCKEDLVILINQFLRFKRFPYTTSNGVVYNFPKGEKPIGKEPGS